MRRVFLLLPLLPLLSACNLELSGLEALDAHADAIADALVVESVVCQETTLEVDQVTQCAAFSPAGAQIRARGMSAVVWGVDSTRVAQVDLDGVLVGAGAGTAVVSAVGARGSRAEVVIVVEET